MTHAEQKRDEWVAIEAFVRLAGVEGVVKPWEAPDALIVRDHETVGVEVVDSIEADVVAQLPVRLSLRNGHARGGAPSVGDPLGRLHAIVARKESKLESYAQAGIRRCWLLVVTRDDIAHGLRREDVRGLQLDSTFDGVAVVDPGSATEAPWFAWVKRPTST